MGLNSFLRRAGHACLSYVSIGLSHLFLGIELLTYKGLDPNVPSGPKHFLGSLLIGLALLAWMLALFHKGGARFGEGLTPPSGSSSKAVPRGLPRLFSKRVEQMLISFFMLLISTAALGLPSARFPIFALIAALFAALAGGLAQTEPPAPSQPPTSQP